ncbi:thioredoxin [Tenacibaculum holothuriorum]|uniref:Thioredoxin n=1 Tax=Tenacibaculum holothuriorum TaxID=1635173 RepID=A0A1Y2PE76_9FLAO|nr:TlpA disulfide reductase family protein [Tenacibaculum holothuriorum]OSY87978.1 thioredoxin [Tenacibaculum holothuriorum]
MKNLLKLLVLLLALGCSKPKNNSLAIFDYKGLQPLLEKSDNITYVVNFWATWCKPCVKELPAFEKLKKEYSEKGVEVILVSLDFPNQIESSLKPFIRKEKLQSKVVVLDDPDQNNWIPKINEKWSGSIPATLIYNKDKREFFERSFTYEELEGELKKFINK